MLGSYATKSGQEYLDNGKKTLSASNTEKMTGLSAQGVDPETYIEYRSIADTNGNGQISQEEAKNALDSMGGLTKEERALLWKATNAAWAEKNNPYK